VQVRLVPSRGVGTSRLLGLTEAHGLTPVWERGSGRFWMDQVTWFIGQREGIP